MEYASERDAKTKTLENELLMSGHGMCPGCGAAIAVRHAMKILGKKSVVLLPPGCVAPGTAKEDAFKFRLPAVHIGLVHGAAIAAGIRAGLEMKGIKDALVIPLMGDGGTADIGFQALSAAAERDDNILYLCLDNEAYMNTGRQGSATTPLGAHTTTTPAGVMAPFGRDRPKKDMFKIICDHYVPYAATACPSYLADFRRKFEKAKQIQGFRYIHVLCPCPTGWGFPSEKTIEVGRLAVRTGMFILAEAEYGRIRITYKVKKRVSVDQYLKLQRRFRHLKDEHFETIQRNIDKQWENYLRMST